MLSVLRFVSLSVLYTLCTISIFQSLSIIKCLSILVLFICVAGHKVLRVDVKVNLSVQHLTHEFDLHFVCVDEYTFSGNQKGDVGVAQEYDGVEDLPDE